MMGIGLTQQKILNRYSGFKIGFQTKSIYQVTEEFIYLLTF